MSNGNDGIEQAGRMALAGERGRSADVVDNGNGHGQVSVGAETARRFTATSSVGGTSPVDSRCIAAAVRAEAPRARNLSLRIASVDSPVAAATSASEYPSRFIQSESRTLGLPTKTPGAPTVLPPAQLADVLAILVAEMVDLLPIADRGGALERLTNRIDGFSRLGGGSDATLMLGAVGGALMRLEG